MGLAEDPRVCDERLIILHYVKYVEIGPFQYEGWVFEQAIIELVLDSALPGYLSSQLKQEPHVF